MKQSYMLFEKFINGDITKDMIPLHDLINADIALSRQVPMAPEHIKRDPDIDIIQSYMCPNCQITGHEMNFYCPMCGQALDWFGGDGE